jgi:rod shape-determining protein MreC
MAPPSPRRPGFSRRAQYGIFATYVIAIFGALLALLLVVTARLDPTGHAALQSLISDVTTPVSNAGRSAIATIGGGGESVSAYFDAASKNKAMTKELAEARRKLIQGQADAVENLRLKRLLGIRDADKTILATARLVASTGTISRRFATLAAGRRDGVSDGQPVRTADGLIGRIVQAGQISSRVLLIIDAERTVPVKRVTDGLPALAIGRGDGMLDIRTLVAGNSPFKAGDVFVTSGTGGIYRPNIPVARIVRHSRNETIARPMADPATFDFALVEPVYVAAPPPPPGEPVLDEGQ